MVSIIIPVYNTFPYLEKCLDSCLQQSYQDIEIIVVNDGSTDNSADLIDSYANKHQNIRVFHQQNKGAAVARNSGIDAARGEWFFFVDSDDYISNDAIESLLSKKEDDTDIIVGDFILDYPNGRTDYIKNSLLTESGEYEPLLSLLDEKTNFSLGGRLFSRKLFENIHTPSELKIGEDSYICIQLFAKARRVEIKNIPVYHYLQRDSSATHRPSKQALQSRLIFIGYALTFLQTHYEDHKRALPYIKRFVMNEFYAYLRMGGEFTSHTIWKYIQSECFSDEKATALLPHWRLLMLKAYLIHPFIGKSVCYIINTSRRVLRK